MLGLSVAMSVLILKATLLYKEGPVTELFRVKDVTAAAR